MNYKKESGFTHFLLLAFVLLAALSGLIYLYLKGGRNNLLGTRTTTVVNFTKIDLSSSRSRSSSTISRLSKDSSIESYTILKASNLASVMSASKITIPLTTSSNINLTKAKSGTGKFTKAKVWVSYSENNAGIKTPFILVQKNGSLVGGFQKNGVDYSLRKLNSTEVVLIKNKKKALPKANDGLTSGMSKVKPMQSKSGGFNLVDVLVTFPEGGVISFDEKNALAELFVANTNEIISNTGLAGVTQLRLVGVVTDPTPYQDGNLESLLIQLSGFGPDPSMFAPSRYYREYFGADIVIGMFPRNSASWNFSGIAFIYPYPEKAFGAVLYNGSDYSFEANIFSHEVGHIFGMHHQKALVPVHPVPEFQFGHGYQAVVNGECRSTILAYQTSGPLGSDGAPCRWFPIYSNPLIKSAETQIGDMFTANNAHVLTSSAPRLSGFKTAAFGGGTGGSCSSYGQSGCGGPCTTSCDCHNSSFTCKDIGGGGDQLECWNESVCGGPAMAVRIKGTVRGCNNETLANVKVSAFGNVVTTNALGKYQITKSNTGQVRETTIMAGADADRGLTLPNSRMFFTSDYSSLINLTCSTINCLFSQRVSNGFGSLTSSDKLLDWGPYRTSYRIQKGGAMTDAYFVKNFVFTNYYAGSFDFKRVDCQPTARILDPHNSGVYRTVQKSSFDLRIMNVETQRFIESKPVSKVSVYAREFGSTENINNLGCTGTWFKVGDMYKNGPETNSVQPWYLTWDIRNDSRIVVGKKYLVTINAEAPDNKWCTGNPGKKFVGGTNLDYNTTCADTYFKTFCNPSRNPSATEGMWHILTVQ